MRQDPSQLKETLLMWGFEETSPGVFEHCTKDITLKIVNNELIDEKGDKVDDLERLVSQR